MSTPTTDITPQGTRIIGTLDLIPATALISGFTDGKPDHVGESDIQWDGQYTMQDPHGRDIYLDEHASQWVWHPTLAMWVAAEEEVQP